MRAGAGSRAFRHFDNTWLAQRFGRAASRLERQTPYER